ncbi:MAG TPA: transglutaminase domain-containing protein [Tepidisphaeraceae bacterium]|jgi:transglutaminase-like putative cysteine protease
MKSALLAFTLLALMPSIALPSDANTGASLTWTSHDPVISRARDLIGRGQLAEAESLLRSTSSADPAAAAQTIEIIRRIRLDYSLTPGQLLEKLKPQIADVQPADLDAWRDSGQLQFRTIDGQTVYFRREPSNLFRFCPAAIARRIEKPKAANQAILIEHLEQVIAEANRTHQAQVVPIKHQIRFTLTVPANTPGAKAGSTLRAWLPFPQEYRQQSDVTLISAGPGKPMIAGNGFAHRTLYFEHRIIDPAQPVAFEAVYAYTSRAYYPILDDARVQPLPADVSTEYLAERLPHIRFSPTLKETAAQIVGDETNPLAKARKIFHWIDANIRYNAEEEYCIIPSFSEHGLTRRRGDCGIQSTLFITLCRASGVPARWQSGWQTIPGNSNMHDWTEIYVAPWGWLPCDPSYGLKRSDDPAVREFYFGHQDAWRMIVNLDYGHPLAPPKLSLRSEPADFQRGEVELDGKNLYFDQFDYDFSFTQSAAGGGKL